MLSAGYIVMPVGGDKWLIWINQSKQVTFYEGVIELVTQSIHSETWFIHTWNTTYCVLQVAIVLFIELQDITACGFVWNYFYW